MIVLKRTKSASGALKVQGSKCLHQNLNVQNMISSSKLEISEHLQTDIIARSKFNKYIRT